MPLTAQPCKAFPITAFDFPWAATEPPLRQIDHAHATGKSPDWRPPRRTPNHGASPTSTPGGCLPECFPVARTRPSAYSDPAELWKQNNSTMTRYLRLLSQVRQRTPIRLFGNE